MDTTHLIPEQNTETLAADIARLNKRAARLGLAPITITWGAPVDVAYVRTSGGGWRRHDAQFDSDIADFEHQGRASYRRFLPVTVNGAAPTLDGWEFVATLEHLDGEAGPLTILRTVPTFEGNLPERFRTATPERCDHCETKRRRNQTFVVRRVGGETAGDAARASVRLPVGSYAQIGRNCLADFFPGSDPHKVAALLSLILDACGAAQGASLDDGEGSGGGSGARRWPLRHVLAITAALIRHEGWVSRGQARDTDLRATADAVITRLNPPPAGSVAADRYDAWTKKTPVEAQDVETANLAYAYARTTLDEKLDRDDYEHNLHVACQVDAVDSRLMGIVCSLIPYYLRAVEREVRRRSAAASRHVGAVGDKLALTALTVSRVTPIDSPFPSWLHTFLDENGCVFKWFSSKKAVAPHATLAGAETPMVEGQTYAVFGTVKGHSEYRGVRETMLTRCVVTTPENMTTVLAAEADKAARKAARAAKAAAKAAKGAQGAAEVLS